METKRDTFFLPQKKKMQDLISISKEKNLNIKQQRQQDFDKTRKEVIKEKIESETKKPFDKKSYRLKKYSKKYKLEQWEEQRRKHLTHKYQKELKNDPVFGSYKPKSFDEDDVDSNPNIGRFVRHPDLVEQETATTAGNTKNKRDPFGKAKEQFVKVKQDKLKKQEEIEKQKMEKNKKMQEYKKNKQERFKKLSKKTKKGQPVMTGRLELLLKKLQNSK